MTKDEYRIGDGPRQMPVWLQREEPLVLTGLDEIPKVGLWLREATIDLAGRRADPVR